MNFGFDFASEKLLPKFRQAFRSRDIFIHDGAAMRRFHISARTQISAAITGMVTLAIAAFGMVDAAVGVSAMSTSRSQIAAMEDRVEALQADVGAIRQTARAHVARLETQQAFLAAVMSGEGDRAKLAALIPERVGEAPAAARDLAHLFKGVDGRQSAMADQVRRSIDADYHRTHAMFKKLGLPVRVASGGGMGGPYEPVTSASAQPVKSGQADPGFRAAFDSWKRRDTLNSAIVAIPSAKPVSDISVNSGFGVRSDPFRGGRAMHAGVDIPGPYATPIYATADGRVGRAGRYGGYGNLVELEHGRGIQTRYGHMSSIVVTPGSLVKRGQLIGLMGSTGRSTGNHLHYEVRLGGRAINPMPFLQTSDYLLAMQKRANTAVGGPIVAAGK